MGQYADDQPLLSLATLRPLFAVLNIRSAFRFHSADLPCVLRDRCTAPIIPQEGGGCTGGNWRHGFSLLERAGGLRRLACFRSFHRWSWGRLALGHCPNRRLYWREKLDRSEKPAKEAASVTA